MSLTTNDLNAIRQTVKEEVNAETTNILTNLAELKFATSEIKSQTLELKSGMSEIKSVISLLTDVQSQQAMVLSAIQQELKQFKRHTRRLSLQYEDLNERFKLAHI